jgi:hypothetical protein
LAVEENSLGKVIYIAPNPSDGLLRLVKTSKEAVDLQLSVYDLFGKLILEESIVLSNSWDKSLHDLPAGMYVVSLKNRQAASKVMKWMKL